MSGVLGSCCGEGQWREFGGIMVCEEWGVRTTRQCSSHSQKGDGMG